MPNTANRRTLKAMMDLLSDNHAEITATAAKVNAALVEADGLAVGDNTLSDIKKSSFKRNLADRHLDTLTVLLASQATRTQRVLAEVEEIQKNIRVI
jgi:hypothetical protein